MCLSVECMYKSGKLGVPQKGLNLMVIRGSGTKWVFDDNLRVIFVRSP